MGFLLIIPRRAAPLAAIVLAAAIWLAGCGPVHVNASGSSSHVDWSVGVPL